VPLKTALKRSMAQIGETCELGVESIAKNSPNILLLGRFGTLEKAKEQKRYDFLLLAILILFTV
jgi:hypothetical protein